VYVSIKNPFVRVRDKKQLTFLSVEFIRNTLTAVRQTQPEPFRWRSYKKITAVIYECP